MRLKLALIVTSLSLACGDSGPPEPEVEMAWGLEVQDLDPALLAIAPLAGTNDLIAVGGPLAGNDPPTMMRRADGVWSDVSVLSTWQGAMWWSWSAGPDDVWVVGDRGQIARGPVGALEMVPTTGTSTNAVLYGVWGSGPNDVWIVGVRTILRWDGARLNSVEPTGTASTATSQALLKVWGSGPNDVMIVGAAGLAIQWDGTRWERTDTKTNFQLTTVHGRGEFEKYAVGGLNQGIVLRYDGFGWREIGPPFAPPLSGVYAGDDGLVWVAGEAGFLASWDGVEWTEVETGMFRAFHAVHSAGDELLGVGGILAVSPDPRKGFVGRFGPFRGSELR